MQNKSLIDWLSWLEKRHPKSIELGLERVGAVATELQISKGAAVTDKITDLIQDILDTREAGK